MVASWLIWSGEVDQVWVVPVYQHAFESIHEKRLVPFNVRMEWCQKMAEELGTNVRVSNIESTLPTPSYSIDTLKALQHQYPQHQFRLVVGADVVSQLPQWKQWSEIEQHFSPIVVGRVGYEGHRAQMVFPDVSSTAIRDSVRKGIIPTQWLIRGVAQSLRENPQVFHK
jgi:nicotinate-nucleotide adenylyltransferase